MVVLWFFPNYAFIDLCKYLGINCQLKYIHKNYIEKEKDTFSMVTKKLFWIWKHIKLKLRGFLKLQLISFLFFQAQFVASRTNPSTAEKALEKEEIKAKKVSEHLLIF